MRSEFEMEILKHHLELERAQHLARSRVSECLKEQEREWGHVHREGSIRDILNRFREQPRPTTTPEVQPA